MPSNVIWGSEGMQYANREFQGSAPLGLTMKFLDGREFVYSQAGGTGLTAGAVQQQAVVVATDIIDLAVPSAEAIGATKVGVTMQSVLTANYYKEGSLFTNTAVGAGYNYKIKSHPADTTGTAEVEFTLEEGSALRVAWDATTKVGLRKHPNDAVIIAPAAETGCVVGVAMRVVTTLYYCWLQKKGFCAVLTNGAVVVGEGVVRGATTPGSVDAYNESSGATNALPIGDVMSVGGSTEYSLINLNIQ